MRSHSAVIAATSLDLQARMLLKAVLFLCGLLAVQRFTLNPANAFICLLPLLLAAFAGLAGRGRVAASCLLLALVFSVDNGGGAYAETPAPIRYAIYMGVFLTLVFSSACRVRTHALLAGCVLLASICVGTLCNVLGGAGVFDSVILRRDLMVLAVLLIFVLRNEGRGLDLDVVLAGATGYLFGELANVLFFFSMGDDYLSYDSLKVFVTFPFLYAMLQGKSRFWQLLMAAFTLPVVLLYGTRMITLSLLLLMLLVALVKSFQSGSFKGYLLLLMIGMSLVVVNVASLIGSDALARFKALYFFLVLVENFDPADLLAMFAALDPVRFAEHQLFFARSGGEVLFGSGLGAGMVDAQGALSFVGYDQTAFGDEEIRTSIYFNLHDFWIDYSLRFGFAPVLLLVFYLTVREMWRGRPWRGVLFGALLINTTFAISGVLLTAMLIRCFPRSHDAD